MGLFSDKKTYVASTVYNLAGDEESRPSYLKSLVIGNVIADRGVGMGSTIQDGYLNGPGIKMRSYYRWAQASYSSVMGVSNGGLGGALSLDLNVLAEQIPHASGETVQVQQAELGLADFEFWAEQWMLANHRAEFNTDWVSDYDDVTGQIIIQRAGGGTYQFLPTGFFKTDLYIMAGYMVTSGTEAAGPLIVGGTTTVGAFPSVSGWTQISLVSNNHVANLVKTTTTTISYSDGRPNETSSTVTNSTPTYTVLDGSWFQEEFLGNVPQPDGSEHLVKRRYTRHHSQTAAVVPVTSSSSSSEVIAGGVTKTTTIGIVEDTLVLTRTVRTDTQDLTTKTWSPVNVFIYRIGSGNAVLDAMVGENANSSGYLPPIPIRLDNEFLSEAYYPDEYEMAKKAYKKLTSSKLDELIEQLTDNPDLEDLDFIYTVPGVSLNTTENSSRKYLYAFFHRAMVSTTTGHTEYLAWLAQQEEASENTVNWNDWREAQWNPTHPLFGTPEPVFSPYPAAPTREIRIATTGNAKVGFDMRIYWQSITEQTGAGLGKVGAKPGDVWLQKGSTISVSKQLYGGLLGIYEKMKELDETFIYWQVTADSWKRLTVVGLIHRNYVYKGKFVEVYASEALDDVDESGFIVPLHYDTWREISLVDSTQMATASLFLVINSYQVVKKKWYQTGIFKIFLVVLAIAVTVYTGGAGAGLLGTAMQVGTALGFVGTMALIVGATANILAAMILMKVLSAGLVAAFGEQIAALIQVVAAVVLVAQGGGFDFSNAAVMWSEMTNPVNLLRITSAVVDAASQFVMADVKDTLKQTQDILENYQAQSEELKKLYDQNIGYGRGVIDPMSLTNAGQWIVESGETFLTRTLMTGGDIADLSMEMLSGFTDLTLSTKLPGQ